MTAPPWSRHLDDASMAVSCGGGHHRVRWSAGTLHLDDHVDLAAEQVLVALGAPLPPCLAALRLFEDAVADGGFLGEWAGRGHADPARTAWLATALERYRSEGVQEFLHGLPIRRLPRMGEALVELPPALLDRAALAVAQGVIDGGRPDDSYVCAQLDEAVRRRVRRAFVRSLATSALPGGSAALTPLRCEVRDGAPRVDGQVSGRAGMVEMRVSRSWLVEVWGTGLAHLDGLLVLEARLDGADVEFGAVTWRPSPEGLRPEPRRAQAHHDGRRWVVA
jgi:hypothetical protein